MLQQPCDGSMPNSSDFTPQDPISSHQRDYLRGPLAPLAAQMGQLDYVRRQQPSCDADPGESTSSGVARSGAQLQSSMTSGQYLHGSSHASMVGGGVNLCPAPAAMFGTTSAYFERCSL